MRFPRTNPANVKFAVSAMATPESDAAPKEATIGKPSFEALKTTSPDNLPVEVRKHSPK
jgi:hypothetical protein